MSDKETCLTCKFFEKIKASNRTYINCRRYPPSPITKNPFPYSQQTEWCGEWKKNEDEK